MKLNVMTPLIVFLMLLALCLSRIVFASNTWCPGNSQNCPTIGCNPVVINEFFCCSNDQSPGGNGVCCSHNCKRIECLPDGFDNMGCLGIGHQTVKAEGTPVVRSQCIQHSWGQACVAEEDEDEEEEG